jgi:hypothetical protein
VVTWILGTLSPELHEIVREPTETARQAWLAIEAQFLGNNESCVLQLDARFRTFKQGDLSVRDYCHRMKGMADDLRALVETVTDRHLVLNLLQGLNKKFDHMKIFIKRSQSFPSFHTVQTTSNSRRLSWTTRRPRDRPPRSTPRPQEEGALRSSSCLHARHRRNHHVLRRPLPLLPPTPTTAAKARERARGRGKARTTAPMAPATTAATTTEAPRRGPPSTIPGPTPSQCGQGCVLRSNSRRVHRSMPYLLHRRTTGLPVALPSRPCRRLHRTSSRSQPLLGRPGRARVINSHWPTPSAPWP